MGNSAGAQSPTIYKHKQPTLCSCSSTWVGCFLMHQFDRGEKLCFFAPMPTALRLILTYAFRPLRTLVRVFVLRSGAVLQRAMHTAFSSVLPCMHYVPPSCFRANRLTACAVSLHRRGCAFLVYTVLTARTVRKLGCPIPSSMYTARLCRAHLTFPTHSLLRCGRRPCISFSSLPFSIAAAHSALGRRRCVRLVAHGLTHVQPTTAWEPSPFLPNRRVQSIPIHASRFVYYY